MVIGPQLWPPNAKCTGGTVVVVPGAAVVVAMQTGAVVLPAGASVVVVPGVELFGPRVVVTCGPAVVVPCGPVVVVGCGACVVLAEGAVPMSMWMLEGFPAVPCALTWQSKSPLIGAWMVTETLAVWLPSPDAESEADWPPMVHESVELETTATRLIESPMLALLIDWLSFIAVKEMTAATPELTSA